MTPAQQARQDLRSRLRDALSNVPPNNPGHQAATVILAGRNISNLTLDELRRAIFALTGQVVVQPTGAPPTPDNGAAYLPESDAGDAGDAGEAGEAGDAGEAGEAGDAGEAGEAGDAGDAGDAETTAIEREMADIRSCVTTGGFIALDERLRALIKAARKPPVTVTVVKEVQITVDPSTPITQSKPLPGRTGTWRALFRVRGPMASRTCQLWDGAHPDTPTVNHDYVWPERTAVALSQIARGRNPYLWGPAGCGKTEFAQQLAARLGRPFMLISCDASTDAATLVGMTVPCKSGGVTFQPGQLVRAIQTAGAVICIDEPSMARPGALFVFQNVLTPNRALYVQETGARIKTAPGVIFLATDNTNGTGGGSRRGFHGTQALNAATMDRFGVRIKLDWHDAATEAAIIMKAVPGCTRALADLLVQAATTTRAAADTQVLTQGLGLRRLFSWAECLTDGVDVETAFMCAVQDCVPEAERETLRQQCMLAVDKHTVARALADPNVTPA